MGLVDRPNMIETSTVTPRRQPGLSAQLLALSVAIISFLLSPAVVTHRCSAGSPLVERFLGVTVAFAAGLFVLRAQSPSRRRWVGLLAALVSLALTLMYFQLIHSASSPWRAGGNRVSP